MHLAPFHPPPGLPFLYGHPSLGQHHAAGVGMNLPQLYFPPHPPLGQHANAGVWGYGPPATGAVPGALPHTGGLQPTLPTSNTTGNPVHTQGVGQVAPQPRRNYPNRQVSDGGTSHLIE